MSSGIFVYCDREGHGHKGRVPVRDFPADRPNWGLPMPNGPVRGKLSGLTIHPIRKLTLTCPRCGYSVRANVNNLVAVLNGLSAPRISLAELAAKL
jgi:hypothetical protein